MILRVLALAGGLTGALGASQFPEFSQQYRQRLGGAVDELARQVTRYEADAQAAGMALPMYLAALAAEGPLARTQAANMAADVTRYQDLSADLARLDGAGPFMRAKLAAQAFDGEIARRAWQTYEPALPLTFEGATFAGTGLLTGWLGLSLVFGFFARLWNTLMAPFRMRRPRHA